MNRGKIWREFIHLKKLFALQLSAMKCIVYYNV